MNPLSAFKTFSSIFPLLARDPGGIKHLHKWLLSQWPGHSPLTDEIPWITYEAIRWLDSYLQPHMRVFEYGSGGSTLYLAGRVKEVTSVEHDETYSSMVKERLASRGVNNCTYLFRPPVALPRENIPAYSLTSFTSFASRYRGMSFENYVCSIDQYPDETFDLVMIDGRSRCSCAQRALPKLRPGGYLLLDNSERPGYKAISNLLKSCKSANYPGLTPSSTFLHETTVWAIGR